MAQKYQISTIYFFYFPIFRRCFFQWKYSCVQKKSSNGWIWKICKIFCVWKDFNLAEKIISSTSPQNSGPLHSNKSQFFFDFTFFEENQLPLIAFFADFRSLCNGELELFLCSFYSGVGTTARKSGQEKLQIFLQILLLRM